jgi:AcrR family transcriptional regulator
MKAASVEKANARRLSPRKKPAQSRAAATVHVILEAAAEILERQGLDGYTTNEIAERAGVSIGSLYQYFPNKDAVTIALIEREMAGMVEEIVAALSLSPPKRALQETIRAAVRNQVRRPQLARMLDFEEFRLAPLMPAYRSAKIIRDSLAAFLQESYGLSVADSEAAAVDVIEIAKALDYASSRRGEIDAPALSQSIEAAVFGYLNAKVEDGAGPATRARGDDAPCRQRPQRRVSS